MVEKLKIKRGWLTKALSIALLIVMGSLMFVSPIKAEAHNAYFIGITIDTANLKYAGVVGFDDNSVIANNHKEAQIADFSSAKIKDDSFSLPSPTLNNDSDKNKGKYENATTGVGKGNGDNGMIFTFPAIHERLTPWHANSVDMDRAYWVSNNIIGGFNEALTFIMNQSEFRKNPGDKISRFMDLSVQVANKGNEAMASGSSTLTYNNVKFAFTKGTNSKPDKEIDKNDYITISANNASVPVVYRVQKGYKANQPLRGSVPSNAIKDVDDAGNNGDIAYLTWKHVALQAHYNYEVKNIGYQSVTEIMQPGKLEQMISDLISNTVGMFRSLLGLYTIQELMLNQGTRGSTYLYGIMPNEWFTASQVLHWVSQLIAWILIMSALVKLLIQRNIASINTSMRINLIEGIQNILLTGFLLSFIIPVFHALGSLNQKLVNVFAETSLWIDVFGTSTASSGLLGGVLLNVLYFFIMLYFNFVYIMRAIIVSLLYGLAPLFVVSIAFGGKYKTLFGNWLKETTSHIFMQSIHAICISFLASASNTGVRGIEGIVLVYAFIPLTQFFRQNLLGMTGGMVEKVGGQALGVGVALVSSGIHKNKGNNKSSSEKGYSSSNGNHSAQPLPNIKSKSSEAYQRKASQEGSLIGKVQSVGDTNDVIPNNELTNLGEKIQGFKDWTTNTKSGKTASGVTRTGTNVAKAGLGVVKNSAQIGAGVGVAMAGASIGNSQLGFMGAMMTAKGVNNLKNSATDMIKPVGGMVSKGYDSFKDSGIYKDSKEGFIYSTDREDGTIDYKHYADGLQNEVGISTINDNDRNIQYELDAKYTNHDGVKFSNSQLNRGVEYDNLNSMVNSFASNDKEAIEYYNKQGIQSVGVNQNTGNLVVTRSKKGTGINSVSKAGNSYVINKDNTAKFTNKELYNIPKYVAKENYSKGSKFDGNTPSNRDKNRVTQK